MITLARLMELFAAATNTIAVQTAQLSQLRAEAAGAAASNSAIMARVNASADLRRLFHGGAPYQHVATNAAGAVVMRLEYPDGYSVELDSPRRPAPPQVPSAASVAQRLLAEARAARAAALARTNVVTVVNRIGGAR